MLHSKVRSELPNKSFKTNWVFPKIGVPQNGWFIMENPIKLDDLGVPLFSETSNWSPIFKYFPVVHLNVAPQKKRRLGNTHVQVP